MNSPEKMSNPEVRVEYWDGTTGVWRDIYQQLKFPLEGPKNYLYNIFGGG